MYHSQSLSRNEKVEINLASERSGLAFFSTEPGDMFGGGFKDYFGVKLRLEGSNKPEFVDDNVNKQSLMKYTDLIE